MTGHCALPDWLRGTMLQVFIGGKAISSMDDLREAYLKREREVVVGFW